MKATYPSKEPSQMTKPAKQPTQFFDGEMPLPLTREKMMEEKMMMTMHLTPPWNLTDQSHPFIRAANLDGVFKLAVDAAFIVARAASASRVEAVTALYTRVLLAWSHMPPEEIEECRTGAESFVHVLSSQHEVV